MVALLGLAAVVYTQEITTPVTIPDDPQGEIIGGFHVLGTDTAILHWWGGLPSTVVRLYVCFDPTCHGPNATREIAQGSGATGSISAPVDSLDAYEINTTDGPALHGSIQLSGLTSLSLIGGILLATGAVVAVWSLRPARRPERPAAVYPERSGSRER